MRVCVYAYVYTNTRTGGVGERDDFHPRYLCPFLFLQAVSENAMTLTLDLPFDQAQIL
jgi:hypothetical protein